MDRYEVVKQLGEGSFGVVNLAKDLENEDRYVVIKTIQNYGQDMEQEKQEAILLSKLNHPNVIQYYDSFLSSESKLCIVLEYADGNDLSKYISRKKLPEKKILSIFSQIIFGLAYIHSQNILHRDIKTENILVFKNGMIKIGDFGISRILSDGELAQSIVGSPYFMAPELFGQSPYSYPADIWAAGCVLYQLMTHKYPFQARSREELMIRVLNGNNPAIPRRFSKELTDLFLQMLSRDPLERPTAADILNRPIIRNALSEFQNQIQLQNVPISLGHQISSQDLFEGLPKHEWMKDNESIAAELEKQACNQLEADKSRLIRQIVQTIKASPQTNPVAHGITSNIQKRKTLLKQEVLDQIGKTAYDISHEFINQNPMETKDGLIRQLISSSIPQDIIQQMTPFVFKNIQTITMIERFSLT